ncbi:PTS system mannose/fructose/N-acetylgalactosamine-transporter subunit IIB [Sporolactobacillus laevolacticus]|uniref:PTS friuctose transporter subunit IIB n=1 Tax=Sporolactobacillus laevolacticus DSM 442 TaxID=1395513 RepID=V6J2H8_9BACL|nr:mannose/fructose/sorbose PTS transporter subunit IIB [Sporolactobacillus laevolacticus]EST10964.1 PTS friuctose transporter subunit IIB [Sporolactobacillus laevolacticus DSM 442]
MIINFARIDDRLIHGQVTTVWVKKANAKRIIICSDEVAHDEIRKTLLKQAAPPGTKVNICEVDKAVKVYFNPVYENETVFYLFVNPTDVLRMVEQNVPIKTLNIGGMAYREGKTQITKAVSVGPEDIEAFRKLNEHGVKLELRVVDSDTPVDIMKKIEGLSSAQ